MEQAVAVDDPAGDDTSAAATAATRRRPSSGGSRGRSTDSDDRAISTVLDVSLALLFIGVSITIVGIHLSGGGQHHEPESAEETAAMLSGTSTKVEFSIEPVTASSDFDSSGISVGNPDYTRDRHGSTMRLIADAAVTNATIDGRELTAASENYYKSIAGELRDRLTEAGISNARVVALWQPYERGSIVGRAEAGPQPPGDADVSIVVMNISSGIPPVDDGAVEAGYRHDGMQGAASPIARAIVDGWFPPDETQIALEKDGFPSDHAAYRYRRFETVLEDEGQSVDYSVLFSVPGGLDPTYIDPTFADADKANDAVVDGLTQYIAADMSSTYSSGITAEEVGGRVSTGHVRVVVKTWSE